MSLMRFHHRGDERAGRLAPAGTCRRIAQAAGEVLGDLVRVMVRTAVCRRLLSKVMSSSLQKSLLVG